MTRRFLMIALLACAAYPAMAKDQPAPEKSKPASIELSAARAVPAAQDRIIARVNGDIITSGDVWERYRMIQLTSRLPDNVSIRQDAFPQILSSLINEKLQAQEAKRIGLSIADEDIDNAVKDLAERNKEDPAKFMDALKKTGVNVAEFRRQLEAQLLWIGTVRRVVRPSVNVTDAEIRTMTEELNSVKGKKEYKFAEIRLPGGTAQEKKDSLKLAVNLMNEMRKGARFSTVAEKFSVADSAKDGGLRPSILEGEMPAPIDKILSEMPTGALSNPLEADGQIWMVLKLGERMNKGAPDEETLRERVGSLKLEKAAAAYLADLRDEAFIEYPG